MVSVSAIVPCYNEEEQIFRTYEAIKAELARYNDVEILFIDDGSTDTTLSQIVEIARQDSQVKYISFTRNFGLEAAFSAGFKYANKEWTVQFDADLQSPPAEAHKLISKALEGYDAVFALRQNRQDPLFRRLGSLGQHWVARQVLKIELPVGGSVFRVVRTSVARKVVMLNLGTPYFLATIPLLGARYTVIPTEHHPRQFGKAKWNLRKLISHSAELFFGFSFRPLSLIYGLVLSGILLYGLALILMLGGVAPATLLTLTGPLMALFGCVSLAIIGRYLQRLMLSTQRPRLFYIRESNLSILPEDNLYEYEPG